MRLLPAARPLARVCAATLAILVAGAACRPAPTTVTSSPDASKAPTAPPPFVGPPLESGVVLDLHVDGIDAGRPALFGETNLPDDTQLELQVSDMDYLRSPPGKPAKGAMMQGKAIVNGGRFDMQGASFSERERRVHPGEWEADVLEPYPFTQPASVQAVVGAKGEHLKGPLVSRNEFGVLVERKVRFTVP